jgi:cytochrome c551/c552
MFDEHRIGAPHTFSAAYDVHDGVDVKGRLQRHHLAAGVRGRHGALAEHGAGLAERTHCEACQATQALACVPSFRKLKKHIADGARNLVKVNPVILNLVV